MQYPQVKKYDEQRWSSTARDMVTCLDRIIQTGDLHPGAVPQGTLGSIQEFFSLALSTQRSEEVSGAWSAGCRATFEEYDLEKIRTEIEGYSRFFGTLNCLLSLGESEVLQVRLLRRFFQRIHERGEEMRQLDKEWAERALWEDRH